MVSALDLSGFTKFLNAPWAFAILTGIIATVIGGVALWAIFERQKDAKGAKLLSQRLEDARALLRAGDAARASEILSELDAEVLREDHARLAAQLTTLRALAAKELAGGGDCERRLRESEVLHMAAARAWGTLGDDEEYARALHNLASVLVRLSEIRDRRAYLTRALAYVARALDSFTEDRFPRDNALANLLLGHILVELAQLEGNSEKNEAAIHACKAAARFFEVAGESGPLAMCLGNVAIAHAQLAEERKDQVQLQKAIEAQSLAVDLHPVERDASRHAKAVHDLGTMYLQLAAFTESVNDLRSGARALQEAEGIYRSLGMLRERAHASLNLASCQFGLGERLRDAGSLREAIQNYCNALDILTLAAHPIDHAAGQMNMGAAHVALADLEEPSGNLEKAIAAMQTAAKVITEEAYPKMHKVLLRNLEEAEAKLAEGQGARGKARDVEEEE